MAKLTTQQTQQIEALTSKELQAIQKKYGLVKTPTAGDIKNFATTGKFTTALTGERESYKGAKGTLSSSQKRQIDSFSDSDLKALQQKYGLNKVPTKSDVQELVQTGTFAPYLYGRTGSSGSSDSQSTGAGTTGGTTGKTIAEQNKANSIYESRDAYLQNLLGAQYGIFDEQTKLQLQQYIDKQQDIDTEMAYYREDFAQATDRKTQDYFTGISLRNKQFSQSLDYIANVASRAIGSLSGVGKNQIVDSTNDKIVDDMRIKLNFDRGMQDMQTSDQRQEARYKLNTTRLKTSRENYETARDKQRKVLGIETAAGVQNMYDTLQTDTILTEDQAAAQRRNITGGGTGVERIFDY